jgi:hypothetical protein
METKTCAKCNQSKPLTEYYKSNDPRYKGNHDYYCKYCRNGSHLTSIRVNKKKCSLDDCANPHYAKGLCRVHYSRNARNGHPNGVIKVVDNSDRRERHLRYKYLMTLEQFDLRSANGCEICGDKPERSLQVDHDHHCCNGEKTCGKCVRGIICNKCNQAVDKMEDGIMRPDYPLYKEVAEYLFNYQINKYKETDNYNCIIASSEESFIAKLDGGKNGKKRT